MNGPDANEGLVEFSFVSQVAKDLPPAVFLRLARQCWSFNTRMGLTGELRLHGDRFAQVIEGRCEIVQPLAARILADRRHSLIRITAFRRLPARRHSGWTVTGFDFETPAAATSAQGAANLHFTPFGARRAAVPTLVPSIGVRTN